jgi:hypothetical protein
MRVSNFHSPCEIGEDLVDLLEEKTMMVIISKIDIIGN